MKEAGKASYLVPACPSDAFIRRINYCAKAGESVQKSKVLQLVVYFYHFEFITLKTIIYMPDILSRKQRSEVMSKVRDADTKPEWILRSGLHRLGFRYRLRNKNLPGRPDLVFPKYRAAVFVHGCFWHRHQGCKDASIPKSNIHFWTRKFKENTERDKRVRHELTERGWRVMVVWECELDKHTIEKIREVALWLTGGGHCSDSPGEYPSPVKRSELLAVAEKKVRHRIASYGRYGFPEDSKKNGTE